MKVTLDWLKEKNACADGVEWFKKQNESDSTKLIWKLFESNHATWAHWLVIRLMDKMQRIRYAVFAAEQVIDIFEKKYPADQRPRKAIEAAKKYLENPSNAAATAAATAAAYAAAYAARKKIQKKILEFGLKLLKRK